MRERDLPGVEIVGRDGTADDRADNGQSWRLESWRAHPVAALVAVALLVAGVAAVAVQQQRGDDHLGRDALREWASDQHDDVDPPAGVVLPDLTCDGDPYDLVAARSCLREAQLTGTLASGHLRADTSYPDALDHWITIGSDGQATMIERQLTVTHRPDVEGIGKIHPWQLNSTTVSWRTWECEGLQFSDEVDVYPGVECEDTLEGAPPEPILHDEQVRELTESERQELVRAYACTHPVELSEYRC